MKTPVEALLAMDGSDFTELVTDNLGKEASKELWAALADPQVASRTMVVLVDAKSDVQTQLSAKRAELDQFHQECMESGDDGKAAYFARKAEVQTWRRAALFFMRLVERRISELRLADAPRVEQARADTQAQGENGPARKRHNKHVLFTLAYLIHSHRESCREADITPEEHDEDLWDALDSLTVLDAYGQPETLADWVEHVIEKPGFEPPSLDGLYPPAGRDRA